MKSDEGTPTKSPKTEPRLENPKLPDKAPNSVKAPSENPDSPVTDRAKHESETPVKPMCRPVKIKSEPRTSPDKSVLKPKTEREKTTTEKEKPKTEKESPVKSKRNSLEATNGKPSSSYAELELKIEALQTGFDAKIKSLQSAIDDQKSFHLKQIKSLMKDLDDERKQRACMQIEVDRLTKLTYGLMEK